MEGAEIYYQKRNERKEKVKLSRRERPGSEVLECGETEQKEILSSSTCRTVSKNERNVERRLEVWSLLGIHGPLI